MPSQTTALDPNRRSPSEVVEQANKKLLERPDKKVPLVEMFGPTISGEGAQIGQQTYFLRFGLCDYRCTMCDSMHAVDPLRVKKGAKWLSQKDIGGAFLEFRKKQQGVTPWVTFSGGNPCIHDLSELVRILTYAGQDIRIAVETQGTMYPKWLDNVATITVSPKSPGMGERFEEDKFLNFMEQTTWRKADGSVSVKIVIFSAEDIDFAAHVYGLLKRKHLLAFHGSSPCFYLSQGNPLFEDQTMSIQALTTSLRVQYLALAEILYRREELCRIKFLPQFHAWLWGNKQGV